jgi:hypothetical protein
VYEWYVGQAAAGGLKADISRQIEKDLDRTMPYEELFCTDEGVGKLRRVLCAYAFKNSVLGYCQSMNFLAALFILVLPEDEAFWTLAYVVEVLLADYFEVSLEGLQVDTLVLETLLKAHTPKAMERLLELQMSLSYVTTAWFLQAFLNVLPNHAALRVMDVLLMEGDQGGGGTVHLRVAVAIVAFFEDKIVLCESAGEVVSMLRPDSLADPETINPEELERLLMFAFRLELDVDIADLRSKRQSEVRRKLEKLRVIGKLGRCTHYTIDELNWTYDQFQQLEKQELSVSDFEALVRYLGTPLQTCAWLLQRVYHVMIRMKQTYPVQGMEFSTLMSLMSILFRGSVVERAKLCVMIFDSDGDFRINQQDLQIALQSLLPISLAQNREYVVGIVTDAFEAAASSNAESDPPLGDAGPTGVPDAALQSARDSEAGAGADIGSPSITVQEWGHFEETEDDEFADEQVPLPAALELIRLCSRLPQSISALLVECGLLSFAPPGCAHAAQCNCSSTSTGIRRRPRQQRAGVESLYVKVTRRRSCCRGGGHSPAAPRSATAPRIGRLGYLLFVLHAL